MWYLNMYHNTCIRSLICQFSHEFGPFTLHDLILPGTSPVLSIKLFLGTLIAEFVILIWSSQSGISVTETCHKSLVPIMI